MAGVCEGAGTGNGEMVRQKRTAAPVTASAGQTPPPARPSKLVGTPDIVWESLYPARAVIQRVGRLPKGRAGPVTVGQDKWPLSRTENLLAFNGPKDFQCGIQNSAYRPARYFLFA